MASSLKASKVGESQSLQSPQSPQSPQSKGQKRTQSEAAEPLQPAEPEIVFSISERMLSQMEGSLAVAKEALQMAAEKSSVQLEAGGDELSSLLAQILEKVSYIERRIDSSQAKVTDTLRHISQFLSEFSLSRAMGDVSILRSWLLSMKAAYLKSGLLLGLPEDQVEQTFQVLMSLAEAKVKLECENNELYSLSQCLHGYGSKSSAQKIKDEASYTEAIQQTELGLRNMRLSVWRSEKLQVELSQWKPEADFSVYLRTEILQAEAMLAKLKALRVRLLEEMAQTKAQDPLMSSVFEKMRAEIVSQFMAEETEAEKMGLEIEARV